MKVNELNPVLPEFWSDLLSQQFTVKSLYKHQQPNTLKGNSHPPERMLQTTSKQSVLCQVWVYLSVSSAIYCFFSVLSFLITQCYLHLQQGCKGNSWKAKPWPLILLLPVSTNSKSLKAKHFIAVSVQDTSCVLLCLFLFFLMSMYTFSKILLLARGFIETQSLTVWKKKI